MLFGESFAEVLESLDLVLQRLRTAGLKLKPSKCSLLQEEVLFLGHRVGSQGMSCDPGKIDAVACWSVPKSVLSFLGTANYYRRFVSDFADKAAPLMALTKKGVPFIWTELCNTSFECLMQKLTSVLILAYPMASETYILDTDASQTGIAAVLSQEQDGVERALLMHPGHFQIVKELTVQHTENY